MSISRKLIVKFYNPKTWWVDGTSYFINIVKNYTLISRMTSNLIYATIGKWSRGLENKKAKIYPTFYKINSVKDIKRFTRDFKIEKLELIEKEPSCLMFNPVVFLLGVLYERILNRFSLLSNFRVNIIGVLKK